MTGIVVLAVIALALIAALESSNRRNASGLTARYGAADDRDVARTKLDLLALGGKAEPFTYKPAADAGAVVHLRRSRLFTHHQHPGRHAA